MPVAEKGKPPQKSSQTKSKQSGKDEIWEDVWVHSVCEMCYAFCGILVHRVNGVVVRVEGDPDAPQNRGKICAKGQAILMDHYDPNRVKNPLKRTNPEKGIGVDPKWKEISWEEALNEIVPKVKEVLKDNPHKLVLSSFDQTFMETPFFQTFMGSWGGPTFQTDAHRCGNAMHAASYKTNATFHNEIDFDYCNYLLLFGGQMGFMTGVNTLANVRAVAAARARGMKMVVIDPRCSNAAAKADEWIPIRPTTDTAMVLSIMNLLVNELGLYDAQFLKEKTNAPYLTLPDGTYARDKKTEKPLVWDKKDNKAKPYDAPIGDIALEGRYEVDKTECKTAFQQIKEHVSKYTPEKASEITTVPVATICRIAREFGEAAKIGATIIIKGRELPYRPAAANYYRGVNACKHGSMGCLAVSMLNFIVGNEYAPGGHTGVNIVGPGLRWEPEADSDGIAIPPPIVAGIYKPYPGYVTPPRDVSLAGFLPYMSSETSSVNVCILEPEKYKTLKPEMLMVVQNNWMMGLEDTQAAAKALKKIPFILYFGTLLDETSEFADIVLPDTHPLEILVLFPNRPYNFLTTTSGYWQWGIMQPVVPPPGQARNWWQDVLFEIADRAGILSNWYKMLNENPELNLKEEYKLDPSQRYTFEEIYDRWAKSEFGPDHGLQWFKEHGYLCRERSVEEKYPRLVIKPRLQIYFEGQLRAGRAVKEMAEKLGFAWDTSDYLAVPDWQPSPAQESMKVSPEYNLYCLNYKTPLHAGSHTTENPWLNEFAEYNPYIYKIMINTDAAKARGIKNGDIICVESKAGKVEGAAKVSECIHPEAVAICGTGGSWAKGKPIARGKGVHHNTLIPCEIDRLGGVDCAKDDKPEVKVYKKES